MTQIARDVAEPRNNIQVSVAQLHEPACIVCNQKQFFDFGYKGHEYWRCPACGIMTTQPYPSEDQIEQHYRSKFKDGNYVLMREYTKELTKGVYSGFLKVLQNELALDGKTLKNKKVLDVGCFVGTFLCLLQEHGADVYGVELQQEAVEIASKLLPGRVSQVNVLDRKFPHDQFDVISLIGVIEHVLDPVPLVARLTELLAPGGLLIIQTPDSKSFFARTLRKYWPPYAPIEHIHLFSAKSLRLLLSKFSYQRVTVRSNWKKLPIEYTYNMLKSFGPEFHTLFKPIWKILPGFLRRTSFPVYIGEMLVTAKRS